LALADCVADDPDWLLFAPDELEILPSALDENNKMMIRRGDVPALLESALFVSAWKEWARFRRFGLPHGSGWRFEKPLVVRVIEALEQEFEAKQAAEWEKQRGKH